MRLNVSRGLRGAASAFVSLMLKDFAEDYDFTSAKSAREYAFTGKQGLKAFTDWLKVRGYRVEMFALEPNRDLFVDAGDNYMAISRTSPSYGFTIADDDPQWVEFKMKNL